MIVCSLVSKNILENVENVLRVGVEGGVQRRLEEIADGALRRPALTPLGKSINAIQFCRRFGCIFNLFLLFQKTNVLF